MKQCWLVISGGLVAFNWGKFHRKCWSRHRAAYTAIIIFLNSLTDNIIINGRQDLRKCFDTWSANEVNPSCCANLPHLLNGVRSLISHVAAITSGPWVIKSSFTRMLISQAKHYVFSHDIFTFNSLAPARWGSNLKCKIFMPTKPKKCSTIRPWRNGAHMFNNILVARSKNYFLLRFLLAPLSCEDAFAMLPPNTFSCKVFHLFCSASFLLTWISNKNKISYKYAHVLITMHCVPISFRAASLGLGQLYTRPTVNQVKWKDMVKTQQNSNHVQNYWHMLYLSIIIHHRLYNSPF